MPLRLEPKFKPPVSDAEYADFKGILERAQKEAMVNYVFWDLGKGESKSEVRKKLSYVAKKEGIGLKIQALRKQNSLHLTFPTATVEKKPRAKRMSAGQAREQILEALQKADKPLSRSDVLERTDVTGASWNARINEMVKEGLVIKEGEKRASTYQIK